MTDAQLNDIIDRLRQGEEIHIRCQDGWWGYRFRAGHFIHFTRYIYEDRTDEAVSEADIREQLASWEYPQLRAFMSPASG